MTESARAVAHGALLEVLMADARAQAARVQRAASARRIMRLARIPSEGRRAAGQLLDTLDRAATPANRDRRRVLDRMGDALAEGPAALEVVLVDIDRLEPDWARWARRWVALALDVQDQLAEAGTPVRPSTPRRGRRTVWWAAR